MAMDATTFISALEELEAAKGISKEEVLEALKEAMIKAYKKQLGGDDADVRCDIDLTKGTIDLYEVKQVRDEVLDDFLEISVEDANRLHPGKKYKDGDEFIIPAPIDELRKATAMRIKAVLRQKFSEKEKAILYDAYKDKIGTIITGRVERIDDKGISVNIGKASVFLPRSQLIGNETFNQGDSIKVYISDVAGDSKGAKINISRSNEGFLRCLFSDADGIHDIYDGTIEIKAIARRAGERSKVAVFSKDPNVDPAAACIGPNGTRIQKIVSQLGNGTVKEKIDIITYSDVPALYIMESIKPAKAIGVEIDEENKEAVLVVSDDALNVAVGKRGVNIALASRLTGYKLNILTETEAEEDQIEYVTYEQAQLEAGERLQRLDREAEIAAREGSLYGTPEGYVAPQERIYADEDNAELDAALTESVEKEEEKPVEEAKPQEEVKPVEEKPVEEEVKTTNVKTTTTIEDLEKSLEEDKSKKNTQKKKTTRKKKDEEEETEETNNTPVTKTDSTPRMSIYTEEELAELEAEEANQEEDYDDEDVDYDEYDEYYDDDDR